MSSLKDQLAKAGFHATVKENDRKHLGNKKTVTNSVKHQQQRTFCEVCDRVQPDVEFYKHRNPTTEAEWICVACADEYMIHDKFRTTAQSDMAKKKMFMRNYGETLDISKARSK